MTWTRVAYACFLVGAVGCAEKESPSRTSTTAAVTSGLLFQDVDRVIGSGTMPPAIGGVAPGVTARPPGGSAGTASGGTSGNPAFAPGQVSSPNGATPSGTGASQPTGAGNLANVGSRFWHAGDTLGNPLKEHTQAEAALALQVIQGLNAERAKMSLPALQADTIAFRAAKAHSEDMLGRGFFDHLTPEGWTPGNRYAMLEGSGQLKLAENLVLGAPTAAQIVQVWMDSPGHRANVLDPAFNQVGVGIAGSAPHVTAVFVQR